MPRIRLCSAVCLASLSWATEGVAQNPPIVVVRQGDNVEWVVTVQGGGPPHKVRFGANGATPVVEIDTIFENITPALTNGDGPQKTTGTLLTAKVKDNAEAAKTFVFACGVHPVQMLSLPFRVEAKVAGQTARTVRIIAGPGLNWHVHVDPTP